jgi:hypothetical protein
MTLSYEDTKKVEALAGFLSQDAGYVVTRSQAVQFALREAVEIAKPTDEPTTPNDPTEGTS